MSEAPENDVSDAEYDAWVESLGKPFSSDESVPDSGKYVPYWKREQQLEDEPPLPQEEIERRLREAAQDPEFKQWVAGHEAREADEKAANQRAVDALNDPNAKPFPGPYSEWDQLTDNIKKSK